MTMLALEVGRCGFTAAQIAEGVDDEDIRRVRFPAGSPWDRCRELLLEVAAGAEVSALGIACPGTIDMAAGVVAIPEIPQWRAGFAIVEAARAVFPTAAVQLALDGVCLALAEHAFGASQGVMDSLAISVSDRISAGMMVGDLAVVGRTGNAGNIGHVLVPGFDERCSCGGHGCLEAVAGGTAVRRWARAQGWSGESVADLVASADVGDEIAVAALGRAGEALGLAVSSVAALLDIDLVVLGGGMATAGPALWKPLGEAVAEHTRLGYLAGLRVVASPLGDIAVLAGAGVLALTALERAAAMARTSAGN
ncbi:ROK family protein [Nocardia tengchongensis]|uniref:ROK family protein n=1 Tax=Nocardia tengchongensis TaxID=2055889 RepID=UPI0036CCF6DA